MKSEARPATEKSSASSRRGRARPGPGLMPFGRGRAGATAGFRGDAAPAWRWVLAGTLALTGSLGAMTGTLTGVARAAEAAPAQAPRAPTPLTLPELAGSVESLDVYADREAGRNTVHLLAGIGGAAERGRTMALFHASSENGGRTWTAPVRVDAGAPGPLLVRRGSDARIIACGDDLLATWTTPGDGAMGTGRLASAVSRDGGRTWSPGVDPAGAAVEGDAKHGYRFIALAARGRTVHLVWLDAKEKARSLWVVRSDDTGRSWGSAKPIDGEICACCWNAAATGPGGQVYALYRDVHPSDMALARSLDGGKTWARVGRPAAFNWEFDGCPHVGGGLAALPLAPGADARAQPALVATVWTGQAERNGGYVTVSPDGGTTWGVPRRLGEPGGSGATGGTRHTDAAALDARRLAVTWDAEASGEPGVERAIFLMHSADRGRTFSAAERLSGDDARAATHPRVVGIEDGRGGGRFLVFWTQADGESRRAVRAVAVDAAAGATVAAGAETSPSAKR